MAVGSFSASVRVVSDRRVGGIQDRWKVLPDGVKRLMRVPDEMRRCVVFLYAVICGDLHLAGTAFFVSHPIPEFRDARQTFLLTAHHIIAGIIDKSDDGVARIRANKRDGSTRWIETAASDWLHPESDVDMAFLFMELPGGIDFMAWPIVPPKVTDPVAVHTAGTEATIATTEVREMEAIGVGDEVFIVGLFAQAAGKRRNEPIVRVGNLAAIPQDPIPTRNYGSTKTILIEARSIGGLSGSPVFVHMGFTRWRGTQVMTSDNDRPFFLLGLMHGHFDTEDLQLDVVDDAGDEKLHTGIGMVVPVEEIMRALQPELDAKLEQRRQELTSENTPTEDNATEEKTITEDSFMEDLHKATRRLDDESDQEQTGTSE